MIGGQVMDLEAEHKHPDAKTLEYIHRSKTGALITACLVTGGLYAGGSNDDIDRLRCFGRKSGLAFQIADDILDVTQTSEQLGKTAGKDVKSDKATYPSLYGLDKSAQMADQLVEEGCDALATYGDGASTLKELAYYLVQRKK
jgi:geranylgeranyl diphosphate synthase type II